MCWDSPTQRKHAPKNGQLQCWWPLPHTFLHNMIYAQNLNQPYCTGQALPGHRKLCRRHGRWTCIKMKQICNYGTSKPPEVNTHVEWKGGLGEMLVAKLHKAKVCPNKSVMIARLVWWRKLHETKFNSKKGNRQFNRILDLLGVQAGIPASGTGSLTVKPSHICSKITLIYIILCVFACLLLCLSVPYTVWSH